MALSLLHSQMSVAFIDTVKHGQILITRPRLTPKCDCLPCLAQGFQSERIYAQSIGQIQLSFRIEPTNCYRLTPRFYSNFRLSKFGGDVCDVSERKRKCGVVMVRSG